MAGNKNSGRPPFDPTDEQREKVRILKGGGMSNEAIAEAIGISHPTLTKYFSLDLEVGAARTTAEMLLARYRTGLAGNATAQNKWLESAGAIPSKPVKVAKGPKPGKKEIAQAEAERKPDDDWGHLLQ